MADKAVTRKSGDGTKYWLLGGLYEVKATGDEANGQATIVGITIPARAGPPPHTHPGGESAYVLGGRIRYHIDGDVHDGGPGSFFHIPEGTWENFEPVEQSRLLVVYTPGGMEKFFAE